MECWSLSDQIGLMTLVVLAFTGIAIVWQSWLMRKSVKDTQERTKKEIRAYVYPTGKAEIVKNHLLEAVHQRSFWCDIEVSNTGKLPATRVTYEWNLQITERSELKSLAASFCTLPLPHLGPGQSLFITGAAHLEESDFKRLPESDNLSLAFWGVIRYHDGWDDQSSEFCFIYTTLDGTPSMRAINPEDSPQKYSNKSS